MKLLNFKEIIKSRNNIFIFIIPIILFIIVFYLMFVKVDTYKRLEVQSEIEAFSVREYHEFESFGDYVYQFVKTMFPNANVYLNNKTTDELRVLCPETSNGQCIVISNSSSKIYPDSLYTIYIFQDGEWRTHLSFSNSNIFHYSPADYVFLDNQVQKVEMTTVSCGDNTNDRICTVIYDEEGDFCYTSQANTYFEMYAKIETRQFMYCPNKMKFLSESEQISTYLIDGFIKLNIPREFSWQYRIENSEHSGF